MTPPPELPLLPYNDPSPFSSLPLSSTFHVDTSPSLALTLSHSTSLSPRVGGHQLH